MASYETGIEYSHPPGGDGSANDATARAAASAAQSTADGNTSSIVALTARIDNRDQKDSVRAASLTNLTLVGTQTVDGVALVAGNRVGVMGQTLGQANGVYVVAAGAWTRATDADTSAKVTDGMYFFVEEGTVNAGKAFELTTPNPITLGTTVLTFAHFAGSLKTSEVVNDSSVVGTTSKDALNTLQTKVGAANLAAYGVLGPAATDLTDAVNELASLTTMAGQQGYMRPGPNTTTFAQAGIGSSATLGTATARAIADTTFLTRRRRYGADSAGTAGSAAGIQFFIAGPLGWFTRNSGFQTVQIMAVSQLSTNVRWFMGHTQTNASTGDPQAMTNMVGIGCNAAGNVQVWTNGASGTATLVKDLGVNFPARNANAVYLLWLFCPPGGSTIYWRVQRLDVPTVDSGTITTNLPVATAQPFPAFWANNNTDATVVKVDILGYEETIPFG